MEDDPNYMGELALDLLTHRDHSLPSFRNISTHLVFLWPINASYLDHVKGETKRASLCYWIEVWRRMKRERVCEKEVAYLIFV